MKKIKLLTPIITTGALIASVSPLTSCGGIFNVPRGNLMTEYTPDIPQRERISEDSPLDVIGAYLTDVKENPKIFVEDMIYTLSRGFPQYSSYVSDFCEIKDQNYNVEIDNVVVDQGNKLISCDIVYDSYYDYTGTKAEELLWYDMPAFEWSTRDKIRLVLDFDTSIAKGFNTKDYPEAQRRQMTTYAGATQFGVSEVNSTIQLLSEEGYYVNLKHKKIKIDNKTPSMPCHFMIPQYDYWESKGDLATYVKNLAEVYDVWYDLIGPQSFVILFKYYLPSNVIDVANTPNTFDFGSYYMANATLNDVFRVSDSVSDKVCYGFNKSLDSINILMNLQEHPEYYHDSKLILPECRTLYANAFNGNLSKYTNIGVPLNTDVVEIPSTYNFIGTDALAGSPLVSGFKKLVFHRPAGSSDVVRFSPYAFDQLLSLETIDLHEFSANYAENVLQSTSTANCWDGSFSGVHLGVIERQEGQIILPTGWDSTTKSEESWRDLLKRAGFTNVYKQGEPDLGWLLVTPA